MLVEGFSQLLRDHSKTINYLAFLVVFFILHLLVKNRYEIVHISHEINNNKKNPTNILFFLSKQSFLH